MMRLRTLDLPERSRLEELRAFLSDNVLPFDMRFDHGPHFPCEVSTGRVGELNVTANVTGPGEVNRTSSSVRQADPGLYQLCLVTHGHAMAEMDDQQARIRPGELVLWNSSRPFRWAHAAHRNIVVGFPRRLMPLAPGNTARLGGPVVLREHGVADLVAELVRRLPRQLSGTAPASGVRLGTALLDLLAVALAERLDDLAALAPDTRRRTLARQILAFIEARLGQAELHPADIAAAHHISVRYLYKLFEAEVGQTVASWIRQRRLDRCRRDLLDQALAERPVSTIAARWGFADASHFSRAFRGHYGIPPAAYRARWETRREYVSRATGSTADV